MSETTKKFGAWRLWLISCTYGTHVWHYLGRLLEGHNQWRI